MSTPDTLPPPPVGCLSSSKTIAKCAEQFGIHSRITLYHLFKDVFGYAPSALRKPVTAKEPA